MRPISLSGNATDLGDKSRSTIISAFVQQTIQCRLPHAPGGMRENVVSLDQGHLASQPPSTGMTAPCI